MRYIKTIILSCLSLTFATFGQEKVDKSLNKAVAYLIKNQKKDGGIYQHKYHTTMTSLAIMSMAALGHMPDDETQEGKAMRRALDFVLNDDKQESNGYFGKKYNSRMYGHGIITLMLAEMMGMGADAKQDEKIRRKLKKSLELIIWSQKQKKDKKNKHNYGGWRYEQKSRDSDLSVTIWQLMSLRAAYDAGMEVPKEAIDAAIGYLKECYHSGRKDGKPTNLKSAFGYTPGKGPNFAMAAAGLLAMQVCGEYDALEVIGARDWLYERKLNYNERFFFYGAYYYAQGLHQAEEKYSQKAKKLVEDILLKNQQPDGSWEPKNGEERDAGRIYAVSMAILSLSVRHHFLPIYQK
ncbi:MAG: terpene cyclase/mutase family protein [Lentisphaeraceae bacterium]|nr:terpene cyclase/mutase family protein [Lentisphaeraceae bacterium]